MANIEVLLPQMGEGVIEATVTRWLVEINSEVSEDEPLVEIATDKVDSEVPSPVSGKLIKTFYAEGEIPKVGDILAIISTSSKDNPNNTIAQEEPAAHIEKHTVEEKKTSAALNAERISSTGPISKVIQTENLSPFIRMYARQRGISIDELSLLHGTGKNGGITKDDVIQYFKSGKSLSHIKGLNGNNKKTTVPIEKKNYIPAEGEIVTELDKTRKKIAEHMQRSVQTAPHVTSFIDVDATSLVQWREQNKKTFFQKYGVNITYTPIITGIVVLALKEFPDINVSLWENQLIQKKYINIGIATALPDGNLIVPVLKNADKINLSKMATDIHDLAQRARNGKLNPGETQGGTFTITNLGQFGNVTGTPIINQPESAILAVGAIKKKPWVVGINGTLTIGIRDIVTLALSYDHRIIDGALGGAFLSRIGSLMENHLPSI